MKYICDVVRKKHRQKSIYQIGNFVKNTLCNGKKTGRKYNKIYSEHF